MVISPFTPAADFVRAKSSGQRAGPIGAAWPERCFRPSVFDPQVLQLPDQTVLLAEGLYQSAILLLLPFAETGEGDARRGQGGSGDDQSHE